MMRKRPLPVGNKRTATIFDPLIAKALGNLKKLAKSDRNRQRVMTEVTELAKKGVSRSELAKCCGVTTRTIGHWLSRLSKSNATACGESVERDLQAEVIPQIKILDVMPAERKTGLWPHIHLRAQWTRIRFHFELG